MNIFFFSFDTRDNAKLYCDAHVIKIILEITQMLYTAIHLLDPEALAEAPNGGYRKTHANHPVAVWVRASQSNWDWTLCFAFDLCDEFIARGFGNGKQHACRKHLEWIQQHVRLSFPVEHFTKPAQAMPDEYKHESTVVAYKKYMLFGKSSFAGGRLPLWNRKHEIPTEFGQLD